MKRSRGIVFALAAIAAAAVGAASAWSGEIVIGLQCDRTGPTQIVGNEEIVPMPQTAADTHVAARNSLGMVSIAMINMSHAMARPETRPPQRPSEKWPGFVERDLRRRA